MEKKLSNEDVASVKRIYEKIDITQAELAKLFQITQPQVSKLVRGLRRKLGK